VVMWGVVDRAKYSQPWHQMISFTVQLLYHREEAPLYLFARGLRGLRSQSGLCGKPISDSSPVQYIARSFAD
jgi:hypothetical protein